MRWIEADPEDLLYEDELLEEEVLMKIDFWDEGWQVAPSDVSHGSVAGELVLTGGKSVYQISRLMTPSSQDIRLIGVRVDDLDSGGVNLQWRSRNEDFGRDRTVHLQPSGTGSEPSGRFRVDLDRVPAWTSDVFEIRLVIRTDGASNPRLTLFEGIGKRLKSGVLREISASPRKVDLGNEVRNSLLLAPGEKIGRRLEVVGPCSLRFALGSQKTMRSVYSVRLTIRDGDDETVLIDEAVGPGTPVFGRWSDRDVDLSRYSGRTVDVTFSALGGETAGFARGVPLLANPEIVPRGFPEDRSPSVVLVSIDALRSDRLSLYGYDYRTSPFLDAWARAKAIVFRNVVAPAPWTLPSHVSMFTGLDAVRHGVNHDVGGVRQKTGASTNSDLLMMAEILRRAGYATGAFTGGAYVGPGFGFAQGFDVFGYWPDRSQDDDELTTGVDAALNWIESHRDEPFFFFLHTYEVHDPYRMREPYFSQMAPEAGLAQGTRIALVSPRNRAEEGFRQRNSFVIRAPGRDGGERPVTDEEYPIVSAMYDSGITFTDSQLGRLFSGLQRLGVGDKTVVVVTADHGEALGMNGRAGHIYPYDSNLMIPIVIATPGGRGAGREVFDQVRLVDLLPTVLALVDVDPPDGIDGVSLTPLIDGKTSPAPTIAFSYASAPVRGLSMRVDNELKYVLDNSAWGSFAGGEEIYDLRFDPEETNNLAPHHPRTAELRKMATAYLENRLSGLRLEIRNPGEGEIDGSILGQLVRPVATKSIALSEPLVTWVKMGSAVFTAPPHVAYSLSFEKVFGSEMRLEGEIVQDGRTVPFKHEFGVDRLGEGTSLVFDGRTWAIRSGALEPGEIGFFLRWHGGASLYDRPPAAEHEMVIEQLRALGYVN